MSVELQSLTPSALRARRTMKWNTYPDDVLAMWVAEMDYPTAPPVMTALQRAVESESFGYPLDAQRSGLGEEVAAYLQRTHGWAVDPKAVFLVADVMRGISLSISTFSEPTDAVIITTPVYMPFFDVVELTGRPQVHIPMRDDEGRATLDLDGIERALAAGARTVLLCNPYNPLGRVFERSELLALAQIVHSHGARVIADEIHAPLVLGGTHLPYASLSPQTAAHTVTILSASKGWNLPGLKCAEVVTSNDADTATWQGLSPWATVGVSTLGIEATLAAYRDGEDWLAEVTALLRRHATIVAEATAGMRGVEHRRNEGTYLAWLDCAGLELDVEPAEFFLDRARVAVNPGPPFRAPEKRFARLNFATTTAILEESLDRMTRVIERR